MVIIIIIHSQLHIGNLGHDITPLVSALPICVVSGINGPRMVVDVSAAEAKSCRGNSGDNDNRVYYVVIGVLAVGVDRKGCIVSIWKWNMIVREEASCMGMDPHVILLLSSVSSS